MPLQYMHDRCRGFSPFHRRKRLPLKSERARIKQNNRFKKSYRYPFTAPLARPDIKYLFLIMYAIKIGKTVSVEPASIKFHDDAASPEDLSATIPTISVRCAGTDWVKLWAADTRSTNPGRKVSQRLPR